MRRGSPKKAIVQASLISENSTMTSVAKPTKRSRNKLHQLLGLRKVDNLPRVTLIAHVGDLASKEAFYEAAFKAAAVGYRSIQLGKALQHYPKAVRDLLSKFNAALPRGPKKAIDLTNKALMATPPNWWRMAPSLGRSDDRSIFVLHDGVIGKTGDGKTNADPKIIASSLGQGIGKKAWLLDSSQQTPIGMGGETGKPALASLIIPVAGTAGRLTLCLEPRLSGRVPAIAPALLDPSPVG